MLFKLFFRNQLPTSMIQFGVEYLIVLVGVAVGTSLLMNWLLA